MTAKLSMICSKQSNGAYFAICPEIRVCFTQGDTYEEAYANLIELVQTTIREELTEKDIEDILMTKNRIFSEFEIVV